MIPTKDTAEQIQDETRCKVGTALPHQTQRHGSRKQRERWGQRAAKARRSTAGALAAVEGVLRDGTGPGRIDRLVAWAGALSPFRCDPPEPPLDEVLRADDAIEDEEYPEFSPPDPSLPIEETGATGEENTERTPSREEREKVYTKVR